ncbi:hypothetical protein F5Y06DRAFT_270550 [Hypoxylon sp. FL0890]|nr:hypothetical protein F5Y06DRAFT_270550 [Hypoxylon sp. FL0890]
MWLIAKRALSSPVLFRLFAFALGSNRFHQNKRHPVFSDLSYLTAPKATFCGRSQLVLTNAPAPISLDPRVPFVGSAHAHSHFPFFRTGNSPQSTTLSKDRQLENSYGC